MNPRFSRLLILALGLSVLAGCGNPRPSAPRLPSLNTVLHVSLRSSLLAPQTAVLQVRNTSSKSLDLVVMFHNRDSNQTRYHGIKELGPYQTQEVGLLESGWVIEPNEEIEIHSQGYEGLKYRTYRTEQGGVGMREPWW